MRSQSVDTSAKPFIADSDIDSEVDSDMDVPADVSQNGDYTMLKEGGA